ncbi:hypothetical protein HDR60_05205 [bacterium]|nr:hypothetical protein [bacterium]
MKSDNNIKIDLVYLWCNASDKNFKQKKDY